MNYLGNLKRRLSTSQGEDDLHAAMTPRTAVHNNNQSALQSSGRTALQHPTIMNLPQDPQDSSTKSVVPPSLLPLTFLAQGTTAAAFSSSSVGDVKEASLRSTSSSSAVSSPRHQQVDASSRDTPPVSPMIVHQSNSSSSYGGAGSLAPTGGTSLATRRRSSVLIPQQRSSSQNPFSSSQQLDGPFSPSTKPFGHLPPQASISSSAPLLKGSASLSDSQQHMERNWLVAPDNSGAKSATTVASSQEPISPNAKKITPPGHRLAAPSRLYQILGLSCLVVIMVGLVHYSSSSLAVLDTTEVSANVETKREYGWSSPDDEEDSDETPRIIFSTDQEAKGVHKNYYYPKAFSPDDDDVTSPHETTAMRPLFYDLLNPAGNPMSAHGTRIILPGRCPIAPADLVPVERTTELFSKGRRRSGSGTTDVDHHEGTKKESKRSSSQRSSTNAFVLVWVESEDDLVPRPRGFSPVDLQSWVRDHLLKIKPTRENREEEDTSLSYDVHFAGPAFTSEVRDPRQPRAPCQDADGALGCIGEKFRILVKERAHYYHGATVIFLGKEGKRGNPSTRLSLQGLHSLLEFRRDRQNLVRAVGSKNKNLDVAALEDQEFLFFSHGAGSFKGARTASEAEWCEYGRFLNGVETSFPPASSSFGNNDTSISTKLVDEFLSLQPIGIGKKRNLRLEPPGIVHFPALSFELIAQLASLADQLWHPKKAVESTSRRASSFAVAPSSHLLRHLLVLAALGTSSDNRSADSTEEGGVSPLLRRREVASTIYSADSAITGSSDRSHPLELFVPDSYLHKVRGLERVGIISSTTRERKGAVMAGKKNQLPFIKVSTSSSSSLPSTSSSSPIGFFKNQHVHAGDASREVTGGLGLLLIVPIQLFNDPTLISGKSSIVEAGARGRPAESTSTFSSDETNKAAEDLIESQIFMIRELIAVYTSVFILPEEVSTGSGPQGGGSQDTTDAEDISEDQKKVFLARLYKGDDGVDESTTTSDRGNISPLRVINREAMINARLESTLTLTETFRSCRSTVTSATTSSPSSPLLPLVLDCLVHARRLKKISHLSGLVVHHLHTFVSPYTLLSESGLVREATRSFHEQHSAAAAREEEHKEEDASSAEDSALSSKRNRQAEPLLLMSKKLIFLPKSALLLDQDSFVALLTDPKEGKSHFRRQQVRHKYRGVEECLSLEGRKSRCCFGTFKSGSTSISSTPKCALVSSSSSLPTSRYQLMAESFVDAAETLRRYYSSKNFQSGVARRNMRTNAEKQTHDTNSLQCHARFSMSSADIKHIDVIFPPQCLHADLHIEGATENSDSSSTLSPSQLVVVQALHARTITIVLAGKEQQGNISLSFVSPNLHRLDLFHENNADDNELSLDTKEDALQHQQPRLDISLHISSTGSIKQPVGLKSQSSQLVLMTSDRSGARILSASRVVSPNAAAEAPITLSFRLPKVQQHSSSKKKHGVSQHRLLSLQDRRLHHKELLMPFSASTGDSGDREGQQQHHHHHLYYKSARPFYLPSIDRPDQEARKEDKAAAKAAGVGYLHRVHNDDEYEKPIALDLGGDDMNTRILDLIIDPASPGIIFDTAAVKNRKAIGKEKKGTSLIKQRRFND